jgi:D-alanyl-D-alanine carboxypeptidase
MVNVLRVVIGVLAVLLVCVAGRWASAGTAPTAGGRTAPSFPDSPAGRRAEALAAALREGNDAAMRRFATENYAASALAERSAEVRVQAMRPVLADLGRGELVSVEPVGERSIELVFKAAAKPLWVRFRLDLEPAPPRGIVGIRIQAEDQPPAPAVSGPPLSESEALAAITAEAKKRAAAGEFSGVLEVAHDGRSLLSHAEGIAERSSGAPVTADTRFNLGSVDKVFTQLVIRQLAEEGKLDLQEHLIHYLPDYPNRAVAEKVTIQQLLDHASGLGDFFGPRFRAAPKETLRQLADYLPLFVDQPLLFEPGSEQRYSNAGYVVLGLVIERLTAKSYYEAVAERVFAPAGMSHSDFSAVDDPVLNRAEGYTHERAGDAAADGGGAGAGAPLRSNVYTLPARGSSAGGGYSTAGDLLRFTVALRGGRLLKSNPWQRQGGVGFAGGSPGCNASIEDDWDSGYTVIVLSNFDPPSAEDLSRAVRGLLARVQRK